MDIYIILGYSWVSSLEWSIIYTHGGVGLVYTEAWQQAGTAQNIILILLEWGGRETDPDILCEVD